MRDEDDVWFDSLAGLHTDEPEKAAGAARAVRAAILARRAAEEPPLQERNEFREAQLIERARADGLLPSNRTGTTRRWPAFLAAAAIAAVGVGVALHMRSPGPVLVTRGPAAPIVRIRDPNPKQLQQELIRELKGAGVTVRGYETFGRLGIDADLPSPLPERVSQILRRRDIAVPADDVLKLEIEPAAP